MLHSFYRDEFLLLRSGGGGGTSPEELRRQMRSRHAACQDGRQCVNQLSEAFAASTAAACRGCCLDVGVADRRHNLAQFAEWRAAQLRKSALTDQSVVRCWSPVQTVPIDWASIRSRRPCICPFLVPNGGGLMWRPACPEAACLLLAQACGVGVDLHLRLATPDGRPAVTPCHSFLMGNFVQLYKSGQWPPRQRLTREGRRLILDLEADRCPPEVVQFVFYSAYGHVICIRENQRVPTPEGLSSLYTVARHVIAEIDSDFRRLADVSGLLANIIVLLNQSVGRLQPVADRHLLEDLAAICRLSPKLFGDLRARLTERIRTQAAGQLTALDESPVECLHQHRRQSRPRDDQELGGQDCLVVNVCATMFREMVLREKQQTPPRPLESCLQCYLAHLVDLHETDRCAAMLQACRDLRCSTGLLSLMMMDQPSSCPSPEHSRLCRMLNHVIQTLLQLTCDQAVLNLADAATFLIRSESSADSPTTSGSIVAVDFQFVTAFTDAAMSALSQCSSSEDVEEKPLSGAVLQGLRRDLSRPEVLAMLKFHNASAGFETARQRLISGAKSTELSDIACHSRQPRLRLLAQSVAAVLLGEQLSMDFNNNSHDSSMDNRLSSEGRRLLIGGGDCGLVSRLRRTQPGSFDAQVTLLSRPQLCRPLVQLGAAAGPPDEAELSPTAGLLTDWIGSAVRCLELLRKTSRTFASSEAVQRGLLRAGGCFEACGRAELIRRLADELLAGGETEPERFSALTELLAMQSCGAADEEEKLDELDFDEEAKKPLKEAAANSKAAFLMRLLPSLQSQQVAAENSS